MRMLGVLFVLVLHFDVSAAGSLSDRFEDGVFGMSWGSSLDTVVGVFPQGDHVFSTTPGRRSYLVRDDQEFLSVVRGGHNILYGFGEQNELVVVTVSFPYERKQELMGALISAFGAPAGSKKEGQLQMTGWRKDQGVFLALVASLEPKHGIVWLNIRGPNYPPER